MPAFTAPPARSRVGRETLSYAVGPCSLGAFAVAESERGLCAVALADDADALLRELHSDFPDADLQPGAVTALETVRAIIEDPAARVITPLDPRGTTFQRRVWNALQQIPPGSTVTYSRLAESLAAPSAVRAVASACAANKLAVIIPCHRVIRRSGELAGFRWGLERKHMLLAREAAAARQHSA